MRSALARLDRLIPALGICQIIGWGSTYYLPGIIAPQLSAATGLSKPMVFASVTVMLLVSSFCGVIAGRFMDRRGARLGLITGSILLAVGLVILSVSSGPFSYFAAWVVIGIAMPLGLSGASHSALVQARGAAGRRGISLLLLYTAAAQAVFWPLTAVMEASLGWRMTCLAFALANLATTVVYARILRPDAHLAILNISSDTPEVGLLPPNHRTYGGALMVVMIALSGFVSWGLELHLMEVLFGFGLGQAAALSIIVFRGPVSIISRLADIAFGRWLTPLDIALGGMLVLFMSLLIAMFVTGYSGAFVFMLLFGAGTGVLTAARATMPLTLFGPAGFATLTGKVGLPTHFMYAIAPPIFGWVIERFGASAALSLAMFSVCGAMAALIGLRGLIQKS